MQTTLPCERRTPTPFRRARMEAPSVGVHEFQIRFRDGLFFRRDPEKLVLDIPGARLTVANYVFKFHCLEVTVGFFAHDTTLRDTSSNELVTIRAYQDNDTFNILRAHLCFIAHAPLGYVPISIRRASARTSVIIDAFPQASPESRVVLKHTRRTDLHYLGIPTQEFLAGRRALKELPPHPNVARILATLRTSDALVTVLPMASTSFSNLLSGPRREEYTLLSIAHGILAGIAHMHANGVVHRNVCPDNILIDGESSPNAILCGFSHAYRVEDQGALMSRLRHKMISRIPPAHFCAPELLPKPKEAAGAAADVWAAGIVLFLLFLRQYPWGRTQEKQITQRRKVVFDSMNRAAKSGQSHWEELNIRADLEDSLPTGVKSLLSALLQPIPDRRLTARAALEHPSFAPILNKPPSDDGRDGISESNQVADTGLTDRDGSVRQTSTVRVASSVLFRNIVKKVWITKSTIDIWVQSSGIQTSEVNSEDSNDSF